jgi:hypothetical protein
LVSGLESAQRCQLTDLVWAVQVGIRGGSGTVTGGSRGGTWRSTPRVLAHTVADNYHWHTAIKGGS